MNAKCVQMIIRGGGAIECTISHRINKKTPSVVDGVFKGGLYVFKG